MPPDSGAKADTFDGPLRATIGLMQCSKDYPFTRSPRRRRTSARACPHALRSPVWSAARVRPNPAMAALIHGA